MSTPTTMLTKDQEIAGTILMQLGGRGRLGVMIGARYFGAVKNGVAFQFKKSPYYNAVRITLNDTDTYDIRLMKWRGTEMKKEKILESIYAEQLREVMEEHTGLALTL